MKRVDAGDDTLDFLKPVHEWLYSFYCMTEGNTIRSVIGNDIWNAEVESIEQANSLVNLRLEAYIAWVAGFKR